MRRLVAIGRLMKISERFIDVGAANAPYVRSGRL